MKFDYQLKPFAPNKMFSVNCDLNVQDSLLMVKFTVSGELNRLCIPEISEKPKRTDNLWQHTCFETFIKINSATKYYEFNVSPSGDWAVYSFSDYRKNMKPTEDIKAIKINTSRDAKNLKCSYSIDKKNLGLTGNKTEIGLCCVLETDNKEISYWAIQHQKEKPDFHLASNFIHI